MALIDDGHLIGFWPLNEASGTPFFRNYSKSYGGYPSGISFDLNVHVADDTGEPQLSSWPGVGSYFNEASGTSHRGLCLHSNYEQGETFFSFCKTLLIGLGDENTRRVTLPPDVVNSGLTIGFWVLPTTDGYDGYEFFGNGTAEQARGNCVVSRGDDDIRFNMGVSGSLAGGTQFNSSKFGGPHQLTGYAFVTTSKSANPETSANASILEAPMESGKFTHLTFTYTHVGGTSNELRLYKDGVLQEFNTTSFDFVQTTTTLFNNFFSFGGTSDGNATQTREVLATCGWNQYVSGIYLFNRPLNASEILTMHQEGGLNPDDGLVPSYPDVVSLENPNLAAYYPFIADGFSDSSINKAPMICDVDPGRVDDLTNDPGPFNSLGLTKQSTSNEYITVSSSGSTSKIAASKSFTIGGNFTSTDYNVGSEYLRNMFFSLGSVGTDITPAISNSTACFSVGLDNTFANGVNFYAKIYEDGSTDNPTVLSYGSPEPGDRVSSNFTLAYDNETGGIAFYVNGTLQESGTISPYFGEVVANVIGSGFPICFLGGIQDQDIYSWAELPSNPAGVTSAMHNGYVFDRALLPSEISYIANKGIDTSPLQRTVHDPRLAGFWPCTDFQMGDTILPDKTANWRGYAGNIVFSLSDGQWSRIQSTDQEGPWYTIDQFSEAEAIPNELSSFGNLGLTSGVFAVMGGSTGSQEANIANADSRSSYSNFSTRYTLFEDDIDASFSHAPTYLMYFEVTPSGDIPASINDAEDSQFNSILIHLGDNSDYLRSYLTTINSNNPDPVGQDAGTGPSGVSIVFTGTDAGITPLASGNVIYGVPNKIAFRYQYGSKFSTNVSLTDEILVDLFINGDRVFSRTVQQNVSRLWSDLAALSVDNVLNIGGYAVNSTPNQPVGTEYVGLGKNYIRNISVLKGNFSGDDIEYFANSGVSESSPLPGFTADLPTTQVTIADSDLSAYWRFNGGVSGELDLTINANDFTLLAKQAIDDGTHGAGANAEGAYNMRFMPGPLINSDLGVRCSGITYAGDSPLTDVLPFYAASGSFFHDPSSDWSIGFRACMRDETNSATNDFISLITYGVLPSTATSTDINDNYGWTIGFDSFEGMKFVGSVHGSLFLDNDSSPIEEFQITCGTSVDSDKGSDNTHERFKQGCLDSPQVDSFSHWCWAYSSSDEEIRCYMNGTLVDRKVVPSGFQQPLDPSARLMTLMIHQDVTPWNFTPDLSADDPILTDLFYFNRTITEQEARYIAFNGIDSATGTTVSGVVGGYIFGQDTGSGIVAAYVQGQDTSSGILGGWMDGAILTSGVVGGYVSGVVFGTGSIGGYLRGLEEASGILGGMILGSDQASGTFAGYIRGQDVGSGVVGALILGGLGTEGSIGGFIDGAVLTSGSIGAFLIGGLSGIIEFEAGFDVSAIAAQDYDSILQVTASESSNFDAKLVVFEDELGPLVEIQVPDSNVEGLTPPFNQYFIAAASGQQGKGIASTYWNFADLTGNKTVSASGAGLYPILHNFANSGIYLVKFTAIDTDGISAADTLIVNASSGVDPVNISISGVPRSGNASLIVDFTTNIDTIPNGVSIASTLLDFGDGQTTLAQNPTHVYTEPGVFTPIWIVRDSRGFIYSDSLEAGNNN